MKVLDYGFPWDVAACAAVIVVGAVLVTALLIKHVVNVYSEPRRARRPYNWQSAGDFPIVLADHRLVHYGAFRVIDGMLDGFGQGADVIELRPTSRFVGRGLSAVNPSVLPGEGGRRPSTGRHAHSTPRAGVRSARLLPTDDLRRNENAPRAVVSRISGQTHNRTGGGHEHPASY